MHDISFTARKVPIVFSYQNYLKQSDCLGNVNLTEKLELLRKEMVYKKKEENNAGFCLPR